jgi:hypothetical protein
VTPGERLRTAADRLDRLQVGASPGPWIGPALSWAGRVTVLNSEGHPVAVTSMEALSVSATADAGLIAALRALAPVIAEQLRAAAWGYLDQVSREGDHDWHDDSAGGCGHYRDPAPLGAHCTCFDDALALADAILGGAS